MPTTDNVPEHAGDVAPAAAVETTAATAGGRWSRQFGVVVSLLVAFAGLVLAMMLLAGGDDLVWQRRVYVFGAVEAIVFTAVGWLFGREVHRTEAQSARLDAAAAKQQATDAQRQARTERGRAAAAEQTATKERARGRAVRAAIDSMAPAPAETEPPPGRGPVDAGGRAAGPVPPSAPSIDLMSFVARLYSDEREG